MNINSLNIRGGVFAAVAAFDAPVDKSTLSSSSGLALVVQRGASEEQLLKYGTSTDGTDIMPQTASSFSWAHAKSVIYGKTLFL